MKPLRLFVNIDHVATIRQARRASEPDPVAAALLCEIGDVDGITAHLREDRRHIQDADVDGLRARLTLPFNLEMACTPEMLRIAERVRPAQVTLVPERREEITTEGGLDVGRDPAALAAAIVRLRQAGIRSSLFVDPLSDVIAQCIALGPDAVELHTGTYARDSAGSGPLGRLRTAAQQAAAAGLAVHAGHGLTVANVGAVSAIAEIEELNIGHSLVSQAVFVGLPYAVRAMRLAMDAGRGWHA